jgi:hypothetical protein
MTLNVIVSCHKDGRRIAMIGQLSAPAKAKPGETAIEGPHQQVLSFNEAGADSVSAGAARLNL